MFSRLVVTMLLLLLQVVWMFVLFHELTAYADWINFICLFISIVMCAALIRQDSTVPEFKISWMALFMIMPVQGGLLYLMWGDHRPAYRLRRKTGKGKQAHQPAAHRCARPVCGAGSHRSPGRPHRGISAGTGQISPLRGYRRDLLSFR